MGFSHPMYSVSSHAMRQPPYKRSSHAMLQLPLTRLPLKLAS